MRVNVSQIGMIEDVERLGAYLQIQRSVESQLTPDCSVNLKIPKPAHQVSRRISGIGLLRQDKRGNGCVWPAVENPPARKPSAGTIERPPRDQVNAAVIAISGGRI